MPSPSSAESRGLACDQIRNLVAEGRLEEAVAGFLHGVEVFAPELRDEAVLLTGRLNTLAAEEARGTITQDAASAERQRIAKALLRFIRNVRRADETTVEAAPLGPKERLARARYLKAFRHTIEGLLKESIHNARLLDLGVRDTRSATDVPSMYQATSALTFDRIDDAFSAYEGRLLILGAPGAGKTTTLYHLALKLLEKAEKDEAAPIPMMVNLSKFRLEASQPRARRWSWWAWREAASPRAFEEWLAGELAANPAVSRGVALKWIQEERVSTLLDGLDEVSAERRAELVRLLNRTFLTDHFQGHVVVCSRIEEYEPLRGHVQTRLQLLGAVTLTPLPEKDIRDYLATARADGLAQALEADASLMEFARTPLTLSMMTLAYAELPQEAIQADLKRTDRWHHLMETYVARMLQRSERRDRNIPFDADKERDVPPGRYRYHPEKVNRYLGWLAVRLSVRMQTSCSPGQLFSFLGRSPVGSQKGGDTWRAALALALLLAVTQTVTFMPHVTDMRGGLLGAAIIAMGILVLVIRGTGAPARYLERLVERISVTSFVVYMAAGFWATLMATVVKSSVVVRSSPVAMGLSAVSALSVVFSVIASGVPAPGKEDRTSPYLRSFGIGFVGALVLSYVLPTLLDHSTPVVSVEEATDRMLNSGLPPRFVNTWGPLIIALSSPRAGLLGALVFVSVQVVGAGWMLRRGLTLEFVAQPQVVLAILVTIVVTSAALLLGPGVEIPTWENFPKGHELDATVLVALAYVVGWTACLFSPTNRAAVLLALALTVCTTAGGLVAGRRGAFVAAVSVYVLGCLIWLFEIVGMVILNQKPWEQSVVARLCRSVRKGVAHGEELVERWLLTPALFVVLAFSRSLPFKAESFFRYCRRALLLKAPGNELEFIHRRLRDHFALRDLMLRLRDTDPRVRLAAIQAVGFQGVSAVEPLAELAAEPDVAVRVAAVSALGHIAAPEAVALLVRAQRDEAPQVRLAAVIGARHVPAETLQEMLLVASEDSDWDVQMAALEASLMTPTDALPVIVGRIRFGGNREALKRLIQILMGWSPLREYPYKEEFGRFALAMPPSVDEVLRLLADDDDDLTRYGAIVLIVWTRPAVTDIELGLRRLRNERMPEVRAVACVLLLRMYDRFASGAGDASQDERSERLAEIRNALRAARADPDATVRAVAIRSIVTLSEPEDVDAVRGMLRKQPTQVRIAAAELLGVRGDLRDVPALQRLLYDEEPNVRAAAVSALNRLAESASDTTSSEAAQEQSH